MKTYNFGNTSTPKYKANKWKPNEQLHLHLLQIPKLITLEKKSSYSQRIIFSSFLFIHFFSFFFFFLTTKETVASCYYSRCFTRLPFASLPSRMTSFPCLHTITECSFTLATYSNSSVKTDGQLSFKYSKPSVCITAAKQKINQRFSQETLLRKTMHH